MPKTVRVDKLRFERILANLLDNAREHAGGPSRVKVEPHGRHGIALAVDDAGPGVARGERARIFERFARGSAARHRVGTGLGLALVAEHAHAHGGEAWVEDRPARRPLQGQLRGGDVMIRRLALISLALVGLVVACGIPDNGGVGRIPDNNLGALNDTIPTTAAPTTIEPTTATIEAETTTTIATEDVTLYFISGGSLRTFTGVLAKGCFGGRGDVGPTERPTIG